MAKKVVSFAMAPEEKAEVDAAIARRKEENSRDRDLDFSKWMREAVIEKLERDDAPVGKKAPDLIQETYRRGEPRKFRQMPVPAVGIASPPSSSTPTHGVNEDEPEAPTRAAKPGPRAPSTRRGIKSIVEAQKTKRTQ